MIHLKITGWLIGILPMGYYNPVANYWAINLFPSYEDLRQHCCFRRASANVQRGNLDGTNGMQKNSFTWCGEGRVKLGNLQKKNPNDGKVFAVLL